MVAFLTKRNGAQFSSPKALSAVPLVKVSVWVPSPRNVPWNELVSLVPTIVETLMSAVSFTNWSL